MKQAYFLFIMWRSNMYLLSWQLKGCCHVWCFLCCAHLIITQIREVCVATWRRILGIYNLSKCIASQQCTLHVWTAACWASCGEATDASTSGEPFMCADVCWCVRYPGHWWVQWSACSAGEWVSWGVTLSVTTDTFTCCEFMWWAPQTDVLHLKLVFLTHLQATCCRNSTVLLRNPGRNAQVWNIHCFLVSCITHYPVLSIILTNVRDRKVLSFCTCEWHCHVICCACWESGDSKHDFRAGILDCNTLKTPHLPHMSQRFG